MVDWEALQSALKGVSRVSILSYCKLIHGLLNTNEQNQKFYGRSNLCPHCGNRPESFPHVVTCPHPDVATYGVQQQKILWKTLSSLRRPQVLIQYMQRGIISSDLAPSEDLISTVQGENSSDQSLCPYSALALEAFNEQSVHLGRDQFLRGRLSKRWKEAFQQELLSRNSWANGTMWAGGVIKAVLTYSLSLWKFRCNLLYGRDKEEADQKIIAELRQKTILAYEEYEKDPFFIRNDYRRLFAVTLDCRLLQDRDCLQCFLATVNLAKEERALHMKRQAETAQRFFFPRSLPILVQLNSSSDNSLSEISDLSDSPPHSSALGPSFSSDASTDAGSLSLDYIV
jgi:hypothetical protein